MLVRVQACRWKWELNTQTPTACSSEIVVCRDACGVQSDTPSSLPQNNNRVTPHSQAQPTVGVITAEATNQGMHSQNIQHKPTFLCLPCTGQKGVELPREDPHQPTTTRPDVALQHCVEHTARKETRSHTKRTALTNYQTAQP